MPTNKNAAFRYRTLNHCFTNRGHRRWTLDELIEEISKRLQDDFGINTTVSRRTIQGDINVMRSPQPRGYGAPIVCKNGAYFYEDPHFTIEKLPLGDNELELLNEALVLLRQFPGLPQLPVLELLVQKTDAGHQLSASHIQFETNQLVRGKQWLAPIYKAIANQQVLTILYQPFLDPEKVLTLHPYLLKEWRNRWYIFGRNGDHKLWNLALDRITDIESNTSVAYLPNDLFNPATWFRDMVGVTKPDGAQPVDITLETSELVSHYLETKPLHHSQQLLERTNGKARFELHVIPNPELLGDLLFFGGELKVVEPEMVREMLAKRKGA
ncbi:MAG: WYL domain-containing protein [Saprospiraceae bacterium]|nr:WYL domain-containing protein [Saprospiraceae bacterium]